MMPLLPYLPLLLILLSTSARAADPIIINAPEQKQFDPNLPDGGLPPVPGVANIQIFRSCRSRPELSDGKGWTYNHHVDMACWKGKLYVGWNSCEKDEDVWPSRQLYSTSNDGLHWSKPAELFPQGIAAALRMYFFHAPNGRMLAIAGVRPSTIQPTTNATPSPLLVREIHTDHSLGSVYHLQGPTSPDAPFFNQSPDADFVQACSQLLGNKPFLEQSDYGRLLPANQRMKWHDPETWPANEPSLSDFPRFGKAMCFYHRADGALVAVMKWGWVLLSHDEGATWSSPARPPTLIVGMAKIWGQRTDDGRYALVYNPSLSQRFPLVLVTSPEGLTFDTMRTVHGELPPLRYPGQYKMIGPQYVRGISEWSTDHSRHDPFLYVAYSMSKEDIWVSRIPLPQPPTKTDTPCWNIYSPSWAAVDLNYDDGKTTTVTLEDHDPFDYARATCLFPPKTAGTITFDLRIEQPGREPLSLDLMPSRSSILVTDIDSTNLNWVQVRIQFDCRQKYAILKINNRSSQIPLAGADSISALSFRTGHRPIPSSRDQDIPVPSFKCQIKNLVLQ